MMLILELNHKVYNIKVHEELAYGPQDVNNMAKAW